MGRKVLFGATWLATVLAALGGGYRLGAGARAERLAAEEARIVDLEAASAARLRDLSAERTREAIAAIDAHQASVARSDR